MITPYPLQDGILIEKCLAEAAGWKQEYAPVSYVSVFVPGSSFVSLGASNNLEINVQIENCNLDGVRVFRRLSGGEAVFLSPNCTVYSHILLSHDIPKAADFFAINLDFITTKLTEQGVSGITRRGISDLSINDRKILGCAIYKKTSFIIFQAVLNVREDPKLIQRYLRHPVREPDYRLSRPHNEFVTSLAEQGYQFSPFDVVNLLQDSFTGQN